MAICRGIQLVNVAAGGTLIQDIPSERPEALKHHQVRPPTEGAHPVTIESGSLLAEILEGKRTMVVNTSHHQAVEDPAPGWRVTARAPDGIIEAVEPSRDAHPFALCVQWHPEAMLPSYGQGVLFDAFCRAAAQTGS
jgi:putative glutamine amidotransferase